MGVFQLKPSFAGGELTPALHGRTDLQKYDVGAARLENAIVLRYGGVTRRPGFRHVAGTAGNNKARLIPFSYNESQNYVIEFTNGNVRVFADGELLDGVNVTVPYLAADLPLIKYAQSADMLFLVHPKYPPASLTRYGALDWRYETLAIENGPFKDTNDTSIKLSASGTTGTITLTATDSFFNQSMVGTLIRIGHTVPSQYVKGNPTTDTLQVSCVPGASVYVESFGFWDGSFVVSRQEEDGTWTQLKKQSGNRSSNYNMTFQNNEDEIRNYSVTSTEFNITVRTGEDEKQRGYVTIQSFSNDYDGIAKITSVSSATTATASVLKKLGNTSATDDFSLSAWDENNGYPQSVGFFEDRLVFGGSPKKPQTYWASKTGDYLNFGTSYPGKDDDAITGTLASGKMNGIKAIVIFGEMIMLTTGGEFRVAGDNGQNFTPTTQQARVQEYRGITDVPPVIIGGRILYVQRGGRIIRDLAYSYDVDKYTGDEVNILASHLFEGQEIVGMAYQQSPESVLWCVRSDGVLLGMTYIKEQDVFAWHRHTTQGEFIDVCSIPGDVEDELWAVVKRDGSYYVEQMTKQSDGVYVDAASVAEGTLEEVTGLSWLAGKTVQIVADGNKIPEREATGGTVELDNTCSRAVVGLGYDTTVTTLPVEINGQDGTWGSRKKRIQNLCIMFRDTIGGRFGFEGKPLDEIKWRSTEAYNEAVRAYTGKKHITLPQANYEDTLKLTIKQTDPCPMTILSIIPEVLPGG